MEVGDILERAASRHQQRRQPTTRRNDDIDSLESDLSKITTTDNTDDISPSAERPHTGRRRRNQSCEATLLPSEDPFQEGSSPRSVTLPFIKCKCRGIDLKAQINTSSPMTVTHSSLVELCSLPSVTSGPPEQPAAFAHCKLTGKIVDVELEIENSRFSIDVFVTADDHPDISLGIDFLKKYQCAISFKDNSFIVGSGSAPVRSRLLLDREISLKYRGARCLAMSI